MRLYSVRFDVALSAGTVIGPYEISAPLGAGGMGEVYRARDTRLHRDVAVKVLRAEVAGDPDRLARLAREARLLASLNHPHIAQVHGLEEANGIRALIMELVEGPTLAERIARGLVPIDEALHIALQIAEALEAAHEQHIIHRDLKPANVKLRPDGTVKVLDFGLAKALDPVADHLEHAGTITAAGLSLPGQIAGTPAYMAPEQAMGKPVDRRADLWAFGCVFYEVLTGRRAFAGDTMSKVFVQVLEHEPDWQRLPQSTPARIRALLQRCLVKDPRRRLDSAAMARLEIEETLSPPSAGVAHPPAVSAKTSSARWRRAAMVAAVTIAAAVLIPLAIAWRTDRENSFGALDVRDPRQITSAVGVESYPTWSPDGTRVAYQAADSTVVVDEHDIWVAQLGTGEPVNLTQGVGNNRMPSWSPNGREVAFLSDRDGMWSVYLVSAIGGGARPVLPLPGIQTSSRSAPQWSADGDTLFVSVRQDSENVVHVLPVTSLESSLVVLPPHEGNACWDLSVSPDGRRFAYIEAGGGGPEVSRLWTISASGHNAVPLSDGRTNVWSPSWSRDGRTIFYVSNRGGTMDLWQQRVGPDGAPDGEPRPLTQGVGMRSAAFTRDGSMLAYSRGGRATTVWRVPIFPDRPATWNDATRLISEHAGIEFLNVSPNGELLALSSDRRGNQDIWLLPPGEGEMTPLTTDPAPDWHPVWSPDGTQIAFYSYRTGNREIFVMPSQGGPARQLTSNPGHDRPMNWSPDGREIAFFSARPEGTGLWVMDADGSNPRFVSTLMGDYGDWLPDGQWLVIPRQDGLYRVAKTGGEAVLIAKTPEPPYTPRASRDGRWVYYNVITGAAQHRGVWRMSIDGRTVSRLTQLDGPRGRIGYFFAAHAMNLYVTWVEDDSDIWVMDVAGAGAR